MIVVGSVRLIDLAIDCGFRFENEARGIAKRGRVDLIHLEVYFLRRYLAHGLGFVCRWRIAL